MLPNRSTDNGFKKIFVIHVISSLGHFLEQYGQKGFFKRPGPPLVFPPSPPFLFILDNHPDLYGSLLNAINLRGDQFRTGGEQKLNPLISH